MDHPITGNSNETEEKQFSSSTHRVFATELHLANINNNHSKLLIHPKDIKSTPESSMVGKILATILQLPPVSSFFAMIQIAVYLFYEKLNVRNEEDVHVSWKTVVMDREVWRLLYAHFFHFGRVHVFFNVITLMSIGRYLETKITRVAFFLLIILMASVSNLLYIFFTDFLCSGPYSDCTFGFSTAAFALRLIYIFTMDNDANNGKGDPNLIFGFIPVDLPPMLAPWHPLIETIFFDAAVMGRCIAANVAGMCAAMLFPYLVKRYRGFIMLPKRPLTQSPPRKLSRHNARNDSNSNVSGGTSEDRKPR